MAKLIEDYDFRLMGMYIDNAKSYIQIAAAGLLLPITFIRQVEGEVHPAIALNLFLKLSWLSFLVSIGAGLLYQYSAVQYIQVTAEKAKTILLLRRPDLIYGIMISFFYLGSVLFVLWALTQL